MTDYTCDNSTMVVSVHIGNDVLLVAKLIGAFSVIPQKRCRISILSYKDLDVSTVSFDPILNVYHVECVTDNQEVMEEYKETGMVIIRKSDYWDEVEVVNYEGDEIFRGINIYLALNSGELFELTNNVFLYVGIDSIIYGRVEQTTYHRVMSY